MGVPIFQWCPHGSVMRPGHQLCSCPAGEVTVAAAKAAPMTVSGSPVSVGNSGASARNRWF